MKAMIFAAGLGTRLRPLTDTTPKALIEVGGRTMLERVILRLKFAGVREIVVNVHHHAEMIRSYLAENNNFGIDIKISDETDLLLDTGGGVAKAAPLLRGDEPIMLYNADILTDFPINEMLATHLRRSALATLLVSQRQSSRSLLFNVQGLMRGWWRTDGSAVRPDGIDPAHLLSAAFCGVHVISPELLDEIVGYAAENGKVFSIIDFYIATCSRNPYFGWTSRNLFSWYDIGRPATLEAARRRYERPDSVCKRK